MKKLFVLKLALGSAFLSMSVTPINADEWIKIYGSGKGYCVKQTSDGGYIVTGYRSFGDTWGACLIKTDSLGEMLWEKVFTDTVKSKGYYVQQTSDGGYIVAGRYYSYREKGFLIKTDSLGNLQWKRIYSTGWKGNYGSVKTVHCCLCCAVQTSDGGYIATGLGADGGQFARIWVIRTDSLGDTLWTRMPPGSGGGGCWVTELPDSNYAIVGYYYGGAETWPVSLIKMNPVGDTLWIKDYLIGPPEGSFSEPGYPNCADTTENKGYILMGQEGIIKVDSIGNVIWKRKYNTSLYFPGIVHTFDSGYVFLSPDAIVKLNSSGDSLWSKKLPERGALYLQETADRGYIVTGEKYQQGHSEIILIKTYPLEGVEEKEKNEQLTPMIIEITPNPLISSCYISYCSISSEPIELGVYDVTGKLVKRLEKGKKGSGIHKVVLDTKSLPTGIYFCILRQGSLISSRKIVVLK